MNAGSQPSGNITYGAPSVPFSGNIPIEVQKQMPRYSGMTSAIGNVYGNPNPSWWDKFSSGLDKNFLNAALGSIGDFGQPTMKAPGGGGGGGGGGAKVGGNVKAAGFLPPVLPGIPAQAPNPGFYLNLPKEQKNRYSGGF